MEVPETFPEVQARIHSGPITSPSVDTHSSPTEQQFSLQ